MSNTPKLKTNPLVNPPKTKHDVPPLDLVKEEHFVPAFDWAIEKAHKGYEKIKKVKNPTFGSVIEAMEHVIALDPKNDQAYFQLGALYDETKNKDKSIANMKRAIELNPKNAPALNYLGYTWAEMGVHLDEAESLILRALKIEPNDGFFIDSLGWVYYQKGDYGKAVEQLERAVEITVDDPTIMEHLGDAYEKNSRLDRALERYREALSKAKEADQIKRIQEKIQRLEKKI